MSANFRHRDNCRLCGSRDLELALKMPATPVGDDYVPKEKLGAPQELFPLDLYFCRGCAHLQLLDVVDPSLLFGNYTFLSASSGKLVEHFKAYADTMAARRSEKTPKLVVEIGSNDGTLLRFFKEKGLDVVGVDPAAGIAQKASESGIPTIAGFFTPALAREILAGHGPAALVAANNVFAHIDDLGSVAEGIRLLLAPEGLFVFEVSSLTDIVRNFLFDTIYHEHLCYHSVRPLQAFLRLHGMELTDVEPIGTKGGSMRCTAKLSSGSRPVSGTVAETISAEARAGIYSLETFQKFSSDIDALKAELLSLLEGLKAEKRSIGGYGASVTVTTLIYRLGLGKFLDFIADDNPSKHGLFSPGYHLPIISPAAMAARKPDYMVILAWNYAQPIMAKNQAYAAGGGRFIIPVPEARVLPPQA